LLSGERQHCTGHPAAFTAMGQQQQGSDRHDGELVGSTHASSGQLRLRKTAHHQQE
jgi:hypothetical protein